MKKLILGAIALFSLSLYTVAKADTGINGNPSILADFGSVKVYVPLTSIDTVYMWDLTTKTSLVGGETPFASWKSLQITAGAVTSLDGQGTPFVGARLELTNPTEAWVPLAAIHPGLFAGRDFRNNAWIYGLKASINVF